MRSVVDGRSAGHPSRERLLAPSRQCFHDDLLYFRLNHLVDRSGNQRPVASMIFVASLGYRRSTHPQ